MSIPEFEQMLHAVLPSTGKTSLTLTEVPRHEGELLVLLEKAVLSGERANTPLTEIHLSKEFYPDMDGEFGDIPVVDSGDADIIRLFFEP
ncbi:hypothetical protein [Methylocella sp. CPCC 101449]|jgi:hypothetical protein|uniref:hypothetical protein n=1 Tax=Methylocella sp. CPCC 101449 TaxID=2987531 RepID=UPI00096261B9|nr:hypothetical protein [Methylocella sp. CPCC 101449]MBN9080364.1 hypothetical protein [Hyphomicrobiales bacterium]MDT2020674.1 hypothetical protein [Methylocella sp. CPCC 101449]OJX99765.1 MAG: hypothetical protein BGP04_19025 [Rhizobiales bacterium 62-17]HEV2574387.1 hypothetical protein [Beijerinckiaceae bacterium]